MSNKTALVTGGSRGIGATITKRLAEDGFNVVFNYNSSKDAAQKVVEECKEKGVEAVTTQANVNNTEDCKALVEKAITEFGRIDVLVNNAGVDGKPNPIWEMNEEDMERIIDTNVKAVLKMSKYASAKMIEAENGGSIVNISSMIASYGAPGMAPYGASKAAVEGMSKSISKDLAPYNINVNCVGPGAVKTDMMKALPEEMKENLLKTVRFNRFAEPSDIAAAVSYFASEDGRYATGQTLIVDGSTNL